MSAVTRTIDAKPAKPVRASKPAPAGQHRSYKMGHGYWWWTLPAVLLMLGVVYLSTASGAFFAFTNWTGVGAFDFTGVDNFLKILQNPELLGALINTLVLAAGFLSFTNVLGLLFALALNRTLKSRYLLRTLLFMPVVLSPIAVSYVWSFIFAFDGPLNEALGWAHLTSWQHDWLADPTLAKLCVLTVMVW